MCPNRHCSASDSRCVVYPLLPQLGRVQRIGSELVLVYSFLVNEVLEHLRQPCDSVPINWKLVISKLFRLVAHGYDVVEGFPFADLLTQLLTKLGIIEFIQSKSCELTLANNVLK